MKRRAAQCVGLRLYGNDVLVRVNLELVSFAARAGFEQRRQGVAIADSESHSAAMDATGKPARLHAGDVRAVPVWRTPRQGERTDERVGRCSRGVTR